jgi:hypothetical protein
MEEHKIIKILTWQLLRNKYNLKKENIAAIFIRVEYRCFVGVKVFVPLPCGTCN